MVSRYQSCDIILLSRSNARNFCYNNLVPVFCFALRAGLDTRTDTGTDFLGERMQYIYLLESSGYYKIGIANDVAARISQLQTGNPNKIELVVCYGFVNAAPVEAVLHQRFSKRKRLGEWFELDNDAIANFHKLCELAGGEYGQYIEPTKDEDVKEAEQEQEFFLDNPDLRIEKRFNPETGQVRGFAFRERNNGRRVVRYVGARDNPEEFKRLLVGDHQPIDNAVTLKTPSALVYPGIELPGEKKMSR